jgi:hypothetical protein
MTAIDPSTPREMDPLATLFQGGHFALFDLYRAHMHAGGGAVIQGRTFVDCIIEGPGLMLIQDGVHFEGVDFGPAGGDMRGMLFRSLNGTMAIGSIPVKDCTFRNCKFHTLGFTGSDSLLQALLAQVQVLD